MPGRHEQVAPRVCARWAAGLAALLATVVTLLALGAAQPASAAAQTVKAQLSLTGVATSDSPAGGSTVGLHPGDSLSLTAAGVPTAGFEKLGLQSLLDGVLGSITSYSVKVDVKSLPGGSSTPIVLTNKTTKTFTFLNKGTYTFTWSATVLGLLGLPVSLDFNQLKSAGVKINAENQFVGKVVVADDPPKGGISIQLPSIAVQPSIPVVGQLPKVGLPGVNAPTISVPSVPNLNPGGNGGGAKPTTTPTKARPSSSGLDLNYQPPGLTIPEQVVPQGGGGVALGNLGGGGRGNGALAGILPGGSVRTGSAGASGTAAAAQDGVTAGKTVDLASDTGDPSSQLPVVLAILAIIALALVAGTYARLFLLKQQD